MSSKKYCFKKLTSSMRDISITEPERDIIPSAPACHSENRVYSSLRANYVCKKHARSWTNRSKLDRMEMSKSKTLIEGNLFCWPPTIGALKSVCTCPSYSEGSQAPEFLVLCMSRVTSVPESGCQPPTQLGAGLEAQKSITQVPQGTLQRFCFSKIVVPGASL